MECYIPLSAEIMGNVGLWKQRGRHTYEYQLLALFTSFSSVGLLLSHPYNTNLAHASMLVTVQWKQGMPRHILPLLPAKA